MPHSTNESLRKFLHIAFGLFAVTLFRFPWWAAAGVAATAVVGNWLILHRIVGRSVSRHERGYDAGIVLYPVAVFLLIVVFRNLLHIAAIAWAMLAFGDGVATLVGKAKPIAPLPWNREKSWGGLLAFFLCGTAGGLGVAWFLWWDYLGLISGGQILTWARWVDFRHPHPQVYVIVVLVALVAAIVESLPLVVDDNLTVPFAASVALLIAGIPPSYPFMTWPQTPSWLIVNAALAIAGYVARSVSFSGALGGWLLGTIIILGAPWPLYACLLAFFVLGTAVTKLGYAKKARAGLAQEGGGRRGFSHAFSNVGVAAICAIAVSRLARSSWGGMGAPELVALFMGIAALATAAADTTASEVGQLIGRRAFLPLTFRRVPVGTEGAISLEGTLAGVFGGFLVALLGCWSVDLLYFNVVFSWRLVLSVTACAFLGSYLESLLGSWNRRQARPIPNGVLNFFNTAAGAILFYYASEMFGLIDWWALMQHEIRLGSVLPPY